MLNFVKRFVSFEKPVPKTTLVALKTYPSEVGICDLIEEVTPPMALAPVDSDEEDFALSMQPSSPAASQPFWFDVRKELVRKVNRLSAEYKDSALNGLKLLVLVENVTLEETLSVCRQVKEVLDLMPESLLTKAAALIESVTPASNCYIAFPAPSKEEEDKGILDAYKRRACFELGDASALVGTGYHVVRRDTLHKALMGFE